MKKAYLIPALKAEEAQAVNMIAESLKVNKDSDKTVDGEDALTKDRLREVLYNLVEAISVGAELLESFMPDTSAKILAQLNAEKRGLDNMTQFGQYPSGRKVTDQPQILFQRLKAEDVAEMVAKMHPEKASAPASDAAADAGQAAGNTSGADDAKNSASDPEPKPEISIDDFAKLQIQVGEVIKCEEVKKSRKLLCSQVKIGSQTRQILSGIKQWYTPEEMVGKKVLVITNLKPAKLAGMMSEGMILCAEDAQGRLSLVRPEGEVDTGAEVR